MAGTRPLILLGLLAALGSCASNKVELVSGIPTREARACAVSGGTLEARGRRQTLMCVHRFADAGKSCTTKSDCKGRCIASSGPNGLPKVGEAATGRCQADDRIFGCFAEVKDGKVASSMCID